MCANLKITYELTNIPETLIFPIFKHQKSVNDRTNWYIISGNREEFPMITNNGSTSWVCLPPNAKNVLFLSNYKIPLPLILLYL